MISDEWYVYFLKYEYVFMQYIDIIMYLYKERGIWKYDSSSEQTFITLSQDRRNSLLIIRSSCFHLYRNINTESIVTAATLKIEWLKKTNIQLPLKKNQEIEQYQKEVVNMLWQLLSTTFIKRIKCRTIFSFFGELHRWAYVCAKF